MDTLTDGWNVSVYQNGDEIYPAENIFNSYGTTGEKYSYTFEDPEDDLFYQALTSDEDEKEIWITAEFPTDTDPETIAVAKLTNVVPSDFANPDYIDGCAEFSYEQVEVGQDEYEYKMFITVHMSEILFGQYESITITGYIDQRYFEITITDPDDLNTELACIEIDTETWESTGEQIQIPNVEEAYVTYSVVGNLSSLPEGILIYDEATFIS